MRTYLIRDLGDNSGKLVGTASVRNAKDLWWTVDEFANPHAFEYLRVRGTCVWLNGMLDEWTLSNCPLTDDDIEAFGEEQGDGSVEQWQTMHELCGGQENFDKMYRDWIAENTVSIQALRQTAEIVRSLGGKDGSLGDET